MNSGSGSRAGRLRIGRVPPALPGAGAPAPRWPLRNSSACVRSTTSRLSVLHSSERSRLLRVGSRQEAPSAAGGRPPPVRRLQARRRRAESPPLPGAASEPLGSPAGSAAGMLLAAAAAAAAPAPPAICSSSGRQARSAATRSRSARLARSACSAAGFRHCGQRAAPDCSWKRRLERMQAEQSARAAAAQTLLRRTFQ